MKYSENVYPYSIEKALRLIMAPDQVTEVRALDAVTHTERRPHVESGYFNDIEKLTCAVANIASAKGIYFIPNPIDSALLARSNNRLRRPGSEPTTSDTNVTRRHWLLIDIDPVRPAGISSTDSEHTSALQCAKDLRARLTAIGWPLPIFADSGNGAHLLYRIDQPCADGGLIRSVLETVSGWVTNNTLKIDSVKEGKDD